MGNLTKWFGATLGSLLLVGLVALPYVERTYAPQNALIRDVGDAAWYALVTLTTVGYGDYYPISVPGQIIGAIFVLSSLGVLGLLIGKVADLFTSYREHRRLGHHGTDATGHIVLFGWNDSTGRVIEQIRTLGRQIVVVTPTREHVDTIHDRFSDAVFPLYADFDDATLLRRINLEDADRALFNIDSDTDTLIYLLNLRKSFPDVEFVVTAQNVELRETFQNAGVAKVVSSNANAAHLIASVIFEPDVAAFAQDLITTSQGPSDYDLQQYVIDPGSPVVQTSFGELFRILYESRGVLAIGLKKRNDGRRIRKLPHDDVPLDAGDILILVATGADITPLQEEYGLGLNKLS